MIPYAGEKGRVETGDSLSISQRRLPGLISLSNVIPGLVPGIQGGMHGRGSFPPSAPLAHIRIDFGDNTVSDTGTQGKKARVMLDQRAGIRQPLPAGKAKELQLLVLQYCNL